MIKLIPDNVNINFVGHKNKIFIVSLSIILGSLFLFFSKSLNYGLDFKGGYVVEAQFPTPPDLSLLREKLAKAYPGEISLQKYGTKGKDLKIKLERIEETENSAAMGDEAEHVVVINKIKAVLGEGVTYRKVETIGPNIGKELVNNAIKAVIFSLLAIAIYIALRFEWQFALCGLIALAQDCIGLVGAYALLWLEFNGTAIVAILTTASYSINDSIVIFDRIRENLKRYRKMPMLELINKSINETLSRTVLTAGTTLLAVFALCLFGGEVIASFSIPIFIGIALGTFSSIALSAPLLLFFKIDREKMANKGKVELTQV
ncbi:hypothetical protein AGMMS49949_03970 [Alphaproteobacteria bacterium]|nr:hypothetical protein AGMMS49949_03970 [Alphaproteobacteria bacterium]GHS96681.1 hypothetical protein AGMMS50296_3090 [Alphaproteobacteria bacterium]